MYFSILRHSAPPIDFPLYHACDTKLRAHIAYSYRIVGYLMPCVLVWYTYSFSNCTLSFLCSLVVRLLLDFKINFWVTFGDFSKGVWIHNVTLVLHFFLKVLKHFFVLVKVWDVSCHSGTYLVVFLVVWQSPLCFTCVFTYFTRGLYRRGAYL